MNKELYYCECCFEPVTPGKTHECDPVIKDKREKELKEWVADELKEHLEWTEGMIKEGVLFRK